MMKTILFQGCTMAFTMMTAIMLSGCSLTDDSLYETTSGEDLEQRQSTGSMHLNFNASLTTFPKESSTRADDEWTWSDGAIVFIQYYNGISRITGHAVYSKATDSWEAFYDGSLGSADRCELYFFYGANITNMSTISLNDNNAIYADKQGNYTITGSTITISGNLQPVTSRIRFSGAQNVSMTVKGIAHFEKYDVTNNTFSTSNNSSRTVRSNGYTDYIYGVFEDEIKRELTVENSIDYGTSFTKSFNNEVLKIGTSGVMTLPTQATNNGWTKMTFEGYFSVENNGQKANFNLIKVGKGSFKMGGSVDVTLTKDYFIGETEVTQALWYAVMGQSPTSNGNSWSSSYGLGDNYPAYHISYEDCQQFLTKLNQLTGQQFRFPSEAEWEFAARGGTKSKGYTYAGSNTIGDVSWNYVSIAHEVKTKKANELGLYDMSGNVEEWCADWYSTSLSGGTDPTGPSTGSKHVLRGGSWYDYNTKCTVSYRDSYDKPSSRSFDFGFRLAL